MFKTEQFQITNEDNIELMAGYGDNHFDLAIVDPPYGLGMSNERPRKDGRFAGNIPRDWDNAVPDGSYFKELIRVSKEQIVWGGNYFDLPPTQGFIFWFKQNPVDNFSDGEYAWTSFQRPAKCFKYRYYGNQEGKSLAQQKIHISQKPVALYEWLLKNYAKEGDKILDTHLGSGSIAIAVDRMNKIEGMNLTLTACELDKDYYEASIKRIKQQTSQTAISL